MGGLGFPAAGFVGVVEEDYRQILVSSIQAIVSATRMAFLEQGERKFFGDIKGIIGVKPHPVSGGQPLPHLPAKILHIDAKSDERNHRQHHKDGYGPFHRFNPGWKMGFWAGGRVEDSRSLEDFGNLVEIVALTLSTSRHAACRWEAIRR